MSIGTPSAGGFAVPEALSSRIIDRARNQARVLQAGALTVPMETNTLAMARVAGDPTAAWKVENAQASASDMTLEAVTFTARTLISIVKASVELMEDADQIDDTIEAGLASALALELDRAALRGTGTAPEPRGIRNQTGVTVTGSIGAPNYGDISTAVQTIRVANGEPNAYILSARDAGTLDRLADTTGQPLQPPPSVAELRQLVTNQIPTNLGAGTNESEIYVGDFSSLLIGVRRSITIEVSRQATTGTDSAFDRLQVHIRAYLRADVQLAVPAHFNVLTGVTV
jgi:HK97 family phage major capsid protein